jgi:hypothetical protein
MRRLPVRLQRRPDAALGAKDEWRHCEL